MQAEDDIRFDGGVDLFGARMDFADSVEEFFALPLHGEELRVTRETIVIFLRLREA